MNTRGNRTSRTIATALNLLLAAAATITIGLTANTHAAPEGGWVVGSTIDQHVRQGIAASQPVNVPTWESHGGAKGCQPLREGVLAETVLVVTLGGDVERMSFAAAWERGQDDEPANNVWVIGQCS